LLYSFEDILNPKLTVKVLGNQWYWTYEFDNWVYYKEKNIDKSSYFNNIYIEATLYNFLKVNVTDENFTKILVKEQKFNGIDAINEKPKKYINLGKDINIINKGLSISYAFNSNILDVNSLNIGSKRLLEVDNRLVLPTNVTLRFLVSSTDVLHSFAVPELGFKIDANPGRLNQILIYINRPGVYYGQCSELCGASHAFMPIVIQAVLPSNFYEYLNKINSIIS
jgi:cytochrome c oxidase subunit 2